VIEGALLLLALVVIMVGTALVLARFLPGPP